LSLPTTRRLLTAALEGSLAGAEFRKDAYFGFKVPVQVQGVEAEILEPIQTWRDKHEFAATALRLVEMFQENFKKIEAAVDHEVRAAGPRASEV
jgi:phosphoenolpyruvate carboxykinase (ATP)